MDDNEPGRDHLKVSDPAWRAQFKEAQERLHFYLRVWEVPQNIPFAKFNLTASDVTKAEFESAYLAWCLLDRTVK